MGLPGEEHVCASSRLYSGCRWYSSAPKPIRTCACPPLFMRHCGGWQYRPRLPEWQPAARRLRELPRDRGHDQRQHAGVCWRRGPLLGKVQPRQRLGERGWGRGGRGLRARVAGGAGFRLQGGHHRLLDGRGRAPRELRAQGLLPRVPLGHTWVGMVLVPDAAVRSQQAQGLDLRAGAGPGQGRAEVPGHPPICVRPHCL
mmetsp:Transcript_78474/g.230144  ORF Transcript_78474/g.230144 Transcript_78474/m.230144 type:complete len:200 (+) Transcript_78474:72-671(+)